MDVTHGRFRNRRDLDTPPPRGPEVRGRGTLRRTVLPSTRGGGYDSVLVVGLPWESPGPSTDEIRGHVPDRDDYSWSRSR